MKNKKIAIIGVGHMGVSIFRGLRKYGNLPSDQFILANPNLEKLSSLKKEFGVRLTRDNTEAARESDIIFIAVRPKIMEKVMKEIKDFVNSDKMIISVVACVPIRLLEKYLGVKKFRIIRIMPNIPVAYGLGVVGWIGNNQIDDSDKKLIKKLLKLLGVVIDCQDEKQLDKLSMISGCGPGYVGYFINNLEKVAQKYGFSYEESRKIVEATFSGTLYHLKKTQTSSEYLVSSVATKGGITEEVINSLKKGHFFELFMESINKGFTKVGKVSRILEKRPLNT